MAKKEEKKINPEKLKGLFKKKANPVEDVGGIKGFEKNENGVVNDKLNNRYFEFGGKKFIVLDRFDSSEFNKPATKNSPNPRFFKLIKEGKTKSGKGWLLCEYKGRKFLIEEPALSYIAAKKVENGFEIDINKSIVVRTNDKGGLKLVPKVPPKLWFGLQDLRKALCKGINSDELMNLVKNGELDINLIEKSTYGKFIAIHPAPIYYTNEQHKIHIYPGKSVVKTGFNGITLEKYCEKYEDRLTFKSFIKDGKIFYRFYLRKIKNSFGNLKKEMPKEENNTENDDLVDAADFLAALPKNKKSELTDFETL